MPLLKVPRRSFLHRATWFGVGLAAALPGLAQNNKSRIKVAFLGCAHSHFRGKYPLIAGSPEWDLVGICEEDPAVRLKGPAGANWIPWSEIESKAEVVIVESAVRHHDRDSLRALEAGKHVHCEKPPSTSLDGLKKLLDLAARKNVLLQVGYMWRFHPGINRALELARSGGLGELYLVRATMNTQVGADERKLWAQFPGGAMFEQGCHLVDPVVRLLGKPTKVSSFLKKTGSDGLDDNCLAVMEYPRVLATVSTAPLQPNAGAHRFFEILGTKGTARVQPLEPAGMELDLAAAVQGDPAGKSTVSLPPYRRYVDEFMELASAIRDRRGLQVSPATELLVQETLLRACGGDSV